MFAVLDRFESRIWQSPHWLAAVVRPVIAVVRDLRDGYLTLRATSLVYTTLLSLVPLLAICFSVLKGMGVQGQVEPFLRNFLEPLGVQSGAVAERIVGFVDKMQVGVLGIVGVALLVYSVVSLMTKIEIAFNDIWRVPGARSFATRLRDYLSVLLIGPLFLFLSAGMTTSLKHAAFMQTWLGIDLLSGAVEKVFQVTPYLLLMLAFAALYMFMPNTRVRPVPALAAGFVTGVLWKVLGILFRVFVAGSSGYAAIYSAFATLILFMIWVYLGWLVVLAGAALCYYLQNPSNQQMARNSHRLGAQDREKIALQICTAIAADFYGVQKGLGVAEISHKMVLPAIVVEDVTEDLCRAGILTVTESWPAHFVPARPFDTTSVDDMLCNLHGGHHGAFDAGRLKISAGVEALLARAATARKKELGSVMLKDLAALEGK